MTKSPLNSVNFPYHSKTAEKQPARSMRLGLGFVAAVLASMLSLPVSAAAPVAPNDPFAGQTWHALTPSWPGTIVFDGKAHKVTLTPLGSAAIEAKYSYTITPAKTGASAQKIEGTLHMTNTAGQVSNSTFSIENAKRLNLTFGDGSRPETYVRMTPAEEAAETARLQKAIAAGKTKPIPKP